MAVGCECSILSTLVLIYGLRRIIASSKEFPPGSLALGAINLSVRLQWCLLKSYISYSLHVLTLIPAVEVWAWVSNFILHVMLDGITNPC